MTSVSSTVKVHLYVRFSTVTQRKGFSLQRQTETWQSFIDSNNHQVGNQYIDDGISGFKTDADERPAFSEMMAHIKAGTIRRNDIIVFENLDRMGRQSVTKQMSLLLNIVSTGVRLYIATDKTLFDENATMVDLMMSLVAMQRANDESATKSFRGQKTWARKLKQFHDGVLVTRNVPSWLIVNEGYGIGDKSLDAVGYHPTHAETVRRIFQLCIDGHGAQAICKVLNSETAPTFRSSARWIPTTVRHILKHRSTFGEWTFKEETKEGYYPAVISKETFLKAQSIIANRTQVGSVGLKTGRRVNLFSGLLRCHHCGSGITYANSNRKSHALRCNGNRQGFCEFNGSMPYKLFEQRMLECISEIEWDDEITDEAGQKLVLEAEIEEIDKRIANISKAISYGGDIPALVKQLTELNANKDDISIQLGELEVASTRLAIDIDETVDEVINGNLEIRNRAAQKIANAVKHIRIIHHKKYKRSNVNDIKAAVIQLRNGQTRQTFILREQYGPNKLLGNYNFGAIPDFEQYDEPERVNTD